MFWSLTSAFLKTFIYKKIYKLVVLIFNFVANSLIQTFLKKFFPDVRIWNIHGKSERKDENSNSRIISKKKKNVVSLGDYSR